MRGLEPLARCRSSPRSPSFSFRPSRPSSGLAAAGRWGGGTELGGLGTRGDVDGLRDAEGTLKGSGTWRGAWRRRRDARGLRDMEATSGSLGTLGVHRGAQGDDGGCRYLLPGGFLTAASLRQLHQQQRPGPAGAKGGGHQRWGGPPKPPHNPPGTPYLRLPPQILLPSPVTPFPSPYLLPLPCGIP